MRKKSRKEIEKEYYQRIQKSLTDFFKKTKMEPVKLVEIKPNETDKIVLKEVKE